MVIDRDLPSSAEKNNVIQAHTGTLKVRDDLYDLGKIKVFVSKELYQASCGIEEIMSNQPHVKGEKHVHVKLSLQKTVLAG